MNWSCCPHRRIWNECNRVKRLSQSKSSCALIESYFTRGHLRNTSGKHRSEHLMNSLSTRVRERSVARFPPGTLLRFVDPETQDKGC